MKGIYSFASVIICTMSIIASCAKVQETELETENEGEGTEKIEAPTEFCYVFGIGAESTDTKSTFSATDKYVSWVEGDDFLGAYAKKDDNTSYNQKCDVVTDPALSFVLKSYYALESGDAIYSYYPYDYINTSTAAYQNPNNVHLSIASAQEQDGETFDPSAMPMVAKFVLTEDLEASTEKEVGTMKFANLAGILDFKVYSSEDTYRTESVKSITFKANSPICGEFNYNLSGLDYENASTMTISGYEGTTITTSVTNATALTGSKSTAYDVCMAVAPGSYTGVVEVVTDKAVYTYNVTSAKTVGRSQIMSLGVNLGTGSRKSIDPTDYDWALVKSTAAVAVGEWIAFVAPSTEVALSTAQKDNNRGEVAITKSGDALTAATDMQMFEVVAGASSGQLAFKAINGDTRGQYIYAASSTKNYLRSKDTVDGNASWDVSVTSAGAATVTAQGSFTHNLLQYNSGSNIFSAYDSAKQGLSIYILDDPSAVKLNASTTSVNFLSTDSTGDGVDVDFAIKNVATWDVDNTNTTDFDVDDAIIDATSGLVTITPKGVNNTYSPKAATVTVSATGADDVVINVSQAAKVAAFTPSTATTTIPASISEFYTITVNSNVPWTAEPTTGADYVEDYDVTGNTTSAPAASDGSVTIEFKDNAGAARTIVFTITPNEVGSGLSAQTITFTQAGNVATPLDAPAAVTFVPSAIDFTATWTNDSNADGYSWVISTSSTAAGIVTDGVGKNVPDGGSGTFTVGSLAGTGASLTGSTWTLSKDITLTGGSTYYFYVLANGSGAHADSEYASTSAKTLYVTGLTNAQIYAAGAAADSYASYAITGDNSLVYNAYAIKKAQNKATSSQHYLQIKKYASSTAYYIQVPTIGTKIVKIRMTVSSTSTTMTGGGNTATYYFSSSNSTSATGSGIVSGTGDSSVTLNTGSLNLNTGYITAGGGTRVWELKVFYEND